MGWVQGICDGWVHYSVMLFSRSKIMKCKHLTYISAVSIMTCESVVSLLPYCHTEDVVHVATSMGRLGGSKDHR